MRSRNGFEVSSASIGLLRLFEGEAVEAAEETAVDQDESLDVLEARLAVEVPGGVCGGEGRAE